MIGNVYKISSRNVRIDKCSDVHNHTNENIGHDSNVRLSSVVCLIGIMMEYSFPFDRGKLHNDDMTTTKQHKLHHCTTDDSIIQKFARQQHFNKALEHVLRQMGSNYVYFVFDIFSSRILQLCSQCMPFLWLPHQYHAINSKLNITLSSTKLTVRPGMYLANNIGYRYEYSSWDFYEWSEILKTDTQMRIYEFQNYARSFRGEYGCLHDKKEIYWKLTMQLLVKLTEYDYTQFYDLHLHPHYIIGISPTILQYKTATSIQSFYPCKLLYLHEHQEVKIKLSNKNKGDIYMTLDNGFCFDKSDIKAAMNFDPKQDPGPIRCFYFNKFKYYSSSPHVRFKQPYPSPSYCTGSVFVITMICVLVELELELHYFLEALMTFRHIVTTFGGTISTISTPVWNRLLRYGKSNESGNNERLVNKMNHDHHDRTILSYHKHNATIEQHSQHSTASPECASKFIYDPTHPMLIGTIKQHKFDL